MGNACLFNSLLSRSAGRRSFANGLSETLLAPAENGLVVARMTQPGPFANGISKVKESEPAMETCIVNPHWFCRYEGVIYARYIGA